jgi:hypothetical protein
VVRWVWAGKNTEIISNKYEHRVIGCLLIRDIIAGHIANKGNVIGGVDKNEWQSELSPKGEKSD